MSDYDCREAEAIHLLHPGSADDHRGGEDVPRRLGRRESRLAGGDREGEEEAGRGEKRWLTLLLTAANSPVSGYCLCQCRRGHAKGG